MNILDRLTQLLKDTPYIDMHDNYFDPELVAKSLIKHGVTIQKWVPVWQRRPDKEFDIIEAAGGHAYPCFIVICSSMDHNRTYIDRGFYQHLHSKDKRWRFLDSNTIDVSDRVTHWMPMPAKPKPIEILHGGGGGGA